MLKNVTPFGAGVVIVKATEVKAFGGTTLYPRRNNFLVLFFLAFTLTWLTPYHFFAQKIRIKILAGSTVNAFNFKVHSGRYQMKLISNTGQVIKVKDFQTESPAYQLKLDSLQEGQQVAFVSKDTNASFEVEVGGWKKYPGALKVKAVNGQLQLMNETELENYLPGVIEAEVGKHNPLEFDKLQAIICRTYALSNWKKHEPDSFNLCDQVHCQAYKGIGSSNLVSKAVTLTKGEVIVDNNLNLITAAFHSNCGGQTANSEDVWALNSGYLRSVTDTFCKAMPNANWISDMAFADFCNYLQAKLGDQRLDSVGLKAVFPFNAAHKRVVNFEFGALKVPLRQLRSDFHLKSALFAMELKGERIQFYGKGYGHGVGMCQEGAMHMAQQGISYKNIILFYYQNVHLVDDSVLHYLREE